MKLLQHPLCQNVGVCALICPFPPLEHLTLLAKLNHTFWKVEANETLLGIPTRARLSSQSRKERQTHNHTKARQIRLGNKVCVFNSTPVK